MTYIRHDNGTAMRRPALGALAILFIPLVFAAGAAKAQTFENLPPVAGAESEDSYRSNSYRSDSRASDAPRVRSVHGNVRGGDAYAAASDAYRPGQTYSQNDAYRPRDAYGSSNQGGYDPDSVYNRGPVPYEDRRQAPAYESRDYDRNGYDRGGYDGGSNGRGDTRYRDTYEDRGERYDDGYGRDGGYREPPPPYRDDFAGADRAPTYSQGEILDAGHSFFGSVSKGLASVVEYAFQSQGAPTGYILGEDAGGAFVAGLRYGEGTLYSRRYPPQKVFWQGPSLGYDFGAEGSKTMVLVYNMDHPSQIFHRYGGVQGSAYLVGGVSIQFQKRGDVTLAPIRSGLGVRLGANVGYLKYTRSPTWNPF